MVVWFLKLLILLVNIRSSHKALVTRPNRNRANRERNGIATIGSSARKKRLKGEVTNWIVWVVYLMLEKLADRVASWVPLYATFKSFVLLLLLLSRGPGSKFVFDKFVKPGVKPWEPTLDFVAFVVGEVVEIAMYCLLFAPRWIATKWRARSSAEPDVPAILRGLRQQNPTPRMAESLAQSLEQSKGHSGRINQRLSRPVTIRLNPIQKPAATTTTARTSTASSLPPHRLGPPPSLPPAAFSTAPFRPIKPSSSSTRVISPITTSSRPVVSTSSRLPISSTRASGPTARSIYPSLDSLPPAPSSCFPAVPSSFARSSVSNPPPSSTINSNSIPPRVSTSSCTIRPNSNAAATVPPPPPPLSDPAHSSPRPTVSVPSSPDRQSRLAQQNPNVTAPPPATPAPPGAFKLNSPVVVGGVIDSSPAPAARVSVQLDDDDDLDQDEDEPVERKPPRPRRPTTTTLTKSATRRTKRSIESVVDVVGKDPGATPQHDHDDYGQDDVNDVGSSTDPPRQEPQQKRSKRSSLASPSDVLRTKVTRGGATGATGGDSRGDVGMTPRQKALGAISQLATDLLDQTDDDDDDSVVGMRNKKKKKTKVAPEQPKARGVLARTNASSITSLRGAGVKGPSSTTTRRTRTRTRSTEEGEKEDESRKDREEEEPVTKRRRKAPPTKVQEKDSLIDEEDKNLQDEPSLASQSGRVARQPAVRKTRTTTTTTTGGNPGEGGNKSSSDRPATVADKTIPRRSDSKTTKTAVTTVSASRTTDPRAPSALAPDSNPVAPKRKARRVLRTADGTRGFDEDVEIEGVAVVAGRRRR